MKLYVRCAILLMAASALVGCQTTEGPHKLGTRISKANSGIRDVRQPVNMAWKSGLSEGFGSYAESDEPETPHWLKRQRLKEKGAVAKKADTASLVSKSAVAAHRNSKSHDGPRPLTRIGSIRQMARRLAPAGVNIASLSGLVSKRRGTKISCFPPELRMLLNTIAWHYGKEVKIQSGYRSKYHNMRVGGARRSFHMACKAVDIYVPGVNKYKLARYLRSLPGRGGVGTYCNTSSVHIDVGPKRRWHYGCGMKSKAWRRLAQYKRSLLRHKSYK